MSVYLGPVVTGPPSLVTDLSRPEQQWCQWLFGQCVIWLSVVCKLLANIPMLFSHSCRRQFSRHSAFKWGDKWWAEKTATTWPMNINTLATHSSAELISHKVSSAILNAAITFNPIMNQAKTRQLSRKCRMKDCCREQSFLLKVRLFVRIITIFSLPQN